ncbi:hypothetical protein F8388_004667 [Cannabis sativa]|uniref:Uncharacterized protein n=2 Tax=Cannabis sativa TaxID=3483 RepID=A0A7J6I3V1_CANSA|nr:hypothetical protein F8388_004667 [Cannabis sativa]KAF4402203.1 hypothetical protein G4B88_017715 [Cannabis sativa]
MDQLEEQHTKSDPLLEYSGFLSTESLDYFSNNEKEISWPDDPPMMKVKAENKLLREEDHDEEIMKIRHELESDVERDLEEEIKEGIYHLALRLHRLHQHRKQRTKRESKNNNNIGGRLFEKEETYSEVNINIKMEGGTKIQIKETKKNDNKITTKPVVNKSYINDSRSSPSSKKPKKFDWINSLRSDSGPVIMTKKIHGNQASMMSNINHGGGGHRLHRGAISLNNDREPLDLGWKI